MSWGSSLENGSGAVWAANAVGLLPHVFIALEILDLHCLYIARSLALTLTVAIVDMDIERDVRSNTLSRSNL